MGARLKKEDLPQELLKNLFDVATFAAQREYSRSMESYVLITMGRKTWRQSLMQSQMQQNHGGSIKKIIGQSELIQFDRDETMNAYMLALKRVLQFAQHLRPPDEISKRL